MLSTATILCMALHSLSVPNAETACEYANVLVRETKRNGIDPALFAALVHVESRWTVNARSRAGACGLTQVLPRYTRPRVTCDQLRSNGDVAIRYGTMALRNWKKRARRLNRRVRLDRALCGYNAGNSCFDRARPPNPRGMSYARSVQRLARKINREMSAIRRNATIE
jgi:soluble lytic murein transglycosylase-like protein